MTFSTSLRVLAVALALTTLSFAAGIAGDLTIADEQRSGQTVVVRIPPELPADSPRARPLRPVVHTAAAEARPRMARVEREAVVDNVVEPIAKPHGERAAPPEKEDPKVDPDRAPKDDANTAPAKGNAPKAG